YLARQELPDRGTAVVEAHTLPYFWLFGLALRSLGKTTIVVPSLSQIGQLGLHDICCVVAPEDEHRPELDAVCAAGGWRLIVVPTAIYAASATGTPPQPPDLSQLPGGHILLTSGT